MAYLRAKCVGGTTIVNQCLLDRYDESRLFRMENFIQVVKFFNEASMSPYYDKVESQLSLQEIEEPQNFNRNTLKFLLKVVKNMVLVGHH
jgi:hypothetical protein